ncbi:MAG TPA: universal stress protein [Vicinamibacteria bacterium]|nr:universal stress protein [Vicinamibacteria bacterium]
MSPRDLILVPLDGSDLAERALAVAAVLARRHGSALRLVHVHLPLATDPIHVEGLPVIDEHLHSLRRDHEKTYLERARDRLAAGVSTSVALLDGAPAAALADEARTRGAALIVMTTHGRGGIERALLGSVADQLVRISPVPMLLVRDGAGGVSSHFRRIVVPLDGSPLSERILQHALYLAQDDPPAELVLVNIVQPPPRGTWAGQAPLGGNTAPQEENARRYLDGVARRLTDAGARVQASVLVAWDVASAVLNFARDETADVIALATHGRSELKRLALGSVADRVVRGTTTPVLVLGPGETLGVEAGPADHAPWLPGSAKVRKEVRR